MAYFYPGVVVTLHVLFEDFKLTSAADPNAVQSFSVYPKSANVTVNDYKTADTFEVSLNYKDFPFDPRSVRALGISIHIQDLKKLSSTPLTSIVPTTDNVRFLGYADEDAIDFDDSGRFVKITGRDLTALLIDRKYQNATVSLTNRVDITIQKLLNELPETKLDAATSSGLKVELRGITTADLPVLSSFMKNDGDHQLNGRKNVDRNQTYWDVIQDILSRAGLIGFIELDKLVITKPRALYNLSDARCFIYGQNIQKLSFKRKIGRKKNFNVVVRSISGKKVLEAKIPKDATKDWCTAVGITQSEVLIPEIGPKGEIVEKSKWKPAPYVSFTIPDCKDKAHLIKVAQELYEEIGRQQIEGTMSTSDMVTGPPSLITGQFYDVLSIRNGTPIQIMIDQGDLRGVSNIRVNQKDGKIDVDATIATRTTFLLSRGYNKNVAQTFAAAIDKFVNVYYTKSIKFDIDSDSGFKCEIEFLNFIDVKQVT